MEKNKLVLEIKNVEYWKSFYRFFKRLFSFFDKMPKELIPEEDEFSIKIDNQLNLSFGEFQIINFELLIKNNINTIIKWPEYLALSNNVIFLSVVGTVFKDENNSHLNNNYIGAITRILYKKYNYSFKFKKNFTFDQYKLVENYIYSNDLFFVVKAPIYNLEIEQKVIKIEDKIYLKKIEESDLNLFNPSFASFGFGLDPFLSSCKTLIETEEKIKKGEPFTVSADTIKNINRVISSLCVYKKNKIGIGPIFSKPKNFWSIFTGIHSSYTHNETYINYKKSTFEKKDLRPFKIFYEKYINSAKMNLWLDLAGKRLLRMFYNMRIEDQIVNIMTIFEMLFLPEEDTELKYRLSIIGAILLGKSYEEKINIYKIFKVSYNIRSSIVHNGLISKGNNKQLEKLKINLNELYEKLQYYLFKSIEIFTKNPDIRNQFEDIIFR